MLDAVANVRLTARDRILDRLLSSVHCLVCCKTSEFLMEKLDGHISLAVSTSSFIFLQHNCLRFPSFSGRFSEQKIFILLFHTWKTNHSPVRFSVFLFFTLLILSASLGHPPIVVLIHGLNLVHALVCTMAPTVTISKEWRATIGVQIWP